MQRYQDEEGMAGGTLAFTESEVFRLAFNIDGLREWSNGDKVYQKDTFNSEGGRYRRAKGNFYRIMEDLGVWGDNRVRSVTSNSDGSGRQGGAVRYY